MTYQHNPNNPRSSFYWNDWLKDPRLAICSLAAQGLWMRLLCVAVNCEQFGYLAVNDHPIELKNLAKMAGCDAQETETLLHELSKNGVFSRDARDIIYSRRLLRDLRASNINRKNGKKGGNPSLRKTKEKAPSDKVAVKRVVKANTSSSSLDSPLTPQRGEDRSKRKENQKSSVWEARVRGFYKSDVWPNGCGPRPNQSGCMAPVEIIERYKHQT